MIQSALSPRKKLFRSLASPDTCIDCESNLLAILKKHPCWAVLVFSIQDHYLFTNLYGDALVRDLEEELVKNLLDAAREETGLEETYCFQPNTGEMLLLWPGTLALMSRLPDTTYAIKLKARSTLKHLMLQKTGREVELVVGHAALVLDQGADIEREFLLTVREARRSAMTRTDLSQLELSST
ncbi:MAG: hypothetical protein KKB70_02575, partial [Proteobacteria bacterium]|nr:hypothetical protein [Pseudomonadota bacterium]MBU1611699.1 hypothetical protein [Pseudomonadota bacterium]